MDVNQLTNAGRETAESLKSTAHNLTEKAKGTVRDAGAAADLYLHEYAWTTVVLLAVSAGLIGFYLGTRRNS